MSSANMVLHAVVQQRIVLSRVRKNLDLKLVGRCFRLWRGRVRCRTTLLNSPARGSCAGLSRKALAQGSCVWRTTQWHPGGSGCCWALVTCRIVLTLVRACGGRLFVLCRCDGRWLPPRACGQASEPYLPGATTSLLYVRLSICPPAPLWLFMEHVVSWGVANLMTLRPPLTPFVLELLWAQPCAGCSDCIVLVPGGLFAGRVPLCVLPPEVCTTRCLCFFFFARQVQDQRELFRACFWIMRTWRRA